MQDWETAGLAPFFFSQMSRRESQSLLLLFNIVSLVNRSCVIVERCHVFNLVRAVENDLSPDSLVGGFTKYEFAY